MTTEPARGFAAIPDRGGFHIHTGTADRAVTIRRITDSAIVVDLSTEVATTVGDRVILRESGRQAVVGGGTVIDPSPPIRIDKNTVKTLALAIGAATSPNDVADALLDARGSVALIALSRDSGGGIPMKGLSVGGTAVASWFADEKLSTALTIVTAYHGEHPRRVGMPSAELATHLGIDRDVLSSFLGARHDLVIDAGSVRRTDFTGTLSQDDEHTWKEVRTQLEASFDVPRASQLAIDREVVHALLRRGDLVRIDDDLVFTARQLDDLVLGVRDLEDGFTVADFRDHFGMTRRQSVPLLEWLDKSGVTRRQGDGRVVRNRLRD
jgi:selenocysteine-specific elongation factor